MKTVNHSVDVAGIPPPRRSAIARLFGALSWQLAGSIAGRLLTFAVAILQARILGKAGYGEVGIVMSTLSVFGLFAAAAGGQTCTKYISELQWQDPDKAGRVSALSVFVSTGLAAAGAIILALFSGPLSVKFLGGYGMEPLLRLSSIALALLTLTGTCSGILLGLQAYRAQSLVSIVPFAIWLALTDQFSLRYGPYGAMLAYTIALAVGLAAAFGVTVRTCRRTGFRMRFRGSWREYPILVSYAIPMMLNGALVFPTGFLCNAILADQPDGYSGVGAYTAALQFRSAVLYLPLVIQSVIWPELGAQFARKDMTEFRDTIEGGFGLIWATAMAVSLACVSVGPQLMSLFGKTFVTDANVMALVMASASTFLISSFCGLVLQTANRTWQTLLINVAYSMVTVGCAWILVRPLHASGIALSLSLGTCIQALISVGFMVKAVPVLSFTRAAALTVAGPILIVVSGSLRQNGTAFVLDVLILIFCLCLAWFFGLSRVVAKRELKVPAVVA